MSNRMDIIYISIQVIIVVKEYVKNIVCFIIFASEEYMGKNKNSCGKD